MNEKALETYLSEQIPISSAMGIQVLLASPKQVILSAPLSNNINHKKTVFGGSLHAVATLTCWSLLHLNLIQENVQIVIASSTIQYLAPVTSDFQAESHMPEEAIWERFIKTLQKRGKARLELKARVFHEGRLCVDYSGVFAALKNL